MARSLRLPRRSLGRTIQNCLVPQSCPARLPTRVIESDHPRATPIRERESRVQREDPPWLKQRPGLLDLRSGRTSRLCRSGTCPDQGARTSGSVLLYRQDHNETNPWEPADVLVSRPVQEIRG